MTKPVTTVAICMPYYRQFEGVTVLSLMDMSARSADAKIAMLPVGVSGCYIEDNRNGAIKHALGTGIPFEWVLWVDSDVTFPGDALIRLLNHNKDIVGANYRTRTPPYPTAGHYADGTRATALAEGGLHLMKHLPTGLLLTRFDIYKKLPEPWFEASLRGPRDDVYFCHRARAHGYEIWCDHDLSREVTHTGVQQIPWFTPDQIQIVEGTPQIDMARAEAEGKRRAEMSGKLYEVATAAE